MSQIIYHLSDIKPSCVLRLKIKVKKTCDQAIAKEVQVEYNKTQAGIGYNVNQQPIIAKWFENTEWVCFAYVFRLENGTNVTDVCSTSCVTDGHTIDQYTIPYRETENANYEVELDSIKEPTTTQSTTTTGTNGSANATLGNTLSVFIVALLTRGLVLFFNH